METIVEKEREIPVVFNVDVVVAGGGPAGVGAAIAAAREGAETLLVERFGHLGGMATGGLVIWLPKNQLSCGLPRELVDRIAAQGAATEEGEWGMTIDPETTIDTVFCMLEEEGVKILLESLAVNAIVEGGKVEGIIIENKSGRQAVKAKLVIDATGDGDIASRAGASFKKVGDEGLMLPMSLIFIMNGVDDDKLFSFVAGDRSLIRLLEETGERDDLFQYDDEVHSLFERASEREKPYHQYSIGVNRTSHSGQMASESAKVYNVDGTDVLDISEAYVKGRKRIRRIVEFLRKHVPGMDSSYLSYVAPQMGVRETRRMVGEYTLTENDLYDGRKFDDVAIRCNVSDLGVCEIPYRCLIPKGLDNILIAGRCISYSHEAQILAREIPLCMLMGQAAGAAAALSIENITTPRELNVKMLQESLRKRGLL